MGGLRPRPAEGHDPGADAHPGAGRPGGGNPGCGRYWGAGGRTHKDYGYVTADDLASSVRGPTGGRQDGLGIAGWIGLALMAGAGLAVVGGNGSEQLAVIFALANSAAAITVLALIPEKLLVIGACTITVSIMLFVFLKLFANLAAG